uniref:SEC16-like protein A, endoplasmic reticulum export factor n=1 Tax=Rousettus aegyptiacus TaxID=9407 RepID=A0A7J8IRK0_ROUAE|nr:SEC16-like protein A, endoplasmic reticulum export factor [Rousettus aegyptiacus]
MQPPPQAVPPSAVGPPPTGSPQSMLWSTSPYRRQATANAPAAPVTRPSQPVTDPFAFSRQALQNTSLGSVSRSSPPILPGPAPPVSLQRPGLPVPHANTGGSSQGPREPLLEPLWQPRADASPFSSVLTPAAPPGPEMNRSAEGASSSEREVQTQYIPGVGPESFPGGHLQRDPPGPDGPPSGQNLHAVAAVPAAAPFFSQPRQQMPGPWGPGGPESLGQHYWPCPEGPVQNMVPQATSVAHFRTPSNPHQGPGHEQSSPLASLPGPLARDGRDETACVQSGHHTGSNFDLENVFRQNFRAGSTRAGQELRPSPGMKTEQLPDPAPVNPPAQGNSPGSHSQYPLGAGTGRALPGADSGVLSMFFQGGETENEENLASEKTGLAGQSDFDGVSLGPGLGHSPAYVGAGSVYQAFLDTPNSETTQRGGDTQPFFPQSAGIQHGQLATERAVVDAWGDPAGAGTRDAGSSHCENAENSEFTQNQEVLPREPSSLDPASPGDQLRYGPVPGPFVPRRSVVGHTGGGGPNIEALEAPPHPVRSDSVSSGYSSKSHRSHPGAARPQDLGTFIQQEVGKPEDEASGSFFKQIDSSPVGGEADEASASPDYHGSLAQPIAPSPPKPTGIFQTSANSSFEPVKSHFVGVKPVEADRANMVGELRETRAHQRQPRPAAAPPDRCPGNLEQPPDNMETLCPAQVCPPRLSTPTEAGHGLPHAGGPPLETVPSTPEKRPATRTHGAAKCESPATTLWAQNELPDFGGNVLLAPAAPALHVPVRPQSSEVIQPPDEGTADPLSRPPGCLPPLHSGDGMGASENLENPPQMGEEEALLSQASSGYASLLSSPPTESLQNQPVLAAQPDQSCNPAQLAFLTDTQATAVAGTLEKDTERFRELLLYGRKKDALESAMKNGLWGHALLLASKMDSRTHARVMTRFANSLPINDPLQTVYQLMSGRMPAASTCCGDEKWGDWRPHLAMVLSNLSNNVDVESRTMATMGDTLASRGLLDAAHFCYLMAQAGFGVYTRKTTKLVLIGSNHSLPFLKFATNEAIQRTEAYEYAQSLGAQSGPLPNFQVFKFIYSCRLAEMGFATQAFHYCEVIAKSILLRPRAHSPVLVRQLVQLASQLRLFDPQLKEKPEEEASVQPAWLSQLQHLERQVQEGAVPQSPDVAFPQRPALSPSPELGQCDGPGLAPPLGPGTDNPLLALPVPGTECLGQGLRLLPSAPLTLPDGPPAIPARVPMFPVQPPLGSVEPGPGCGSPGSALGFAEASGPDPAAPCPGPGLPPGTPSLQESGHRLPEARSQDPGPAPHGVPGGDSLAELRDEDFGGKFDNMGSSRGLQDSEGLPGWGAASPSVPQQLAATPAPEGKSPAPAARKESKEPRKSGESWLSRWLTGKRKTEAYLPDDKNKSIVWDEKKNRWVDVNEPEEEKKAPPPPPMSLPKAPQAAAPGPGGLPGSSVNMFSRKAAGSRARYVDVLNPGGRRQTEPALAPADFFAPLAPLPIPAHLCGPHPDTAEGAGGEGQAPAGGATHAEPASEPQVFSSAAPPPASDVPPHRGDGPQGGELSRCSSMSSLSREVSQHFNQAPSDHAAAEGPPGATVPFYDPAHFAQASATSGSSRMGRIGQRKYPALN